MSGAGNMLNVILAFRNSGAGFHAPLRLKAVLIHLFEKNCLDEADYGACRWLIDELFSAAAPAAFAVSGTDDPYAAAIASFRPYVEFFGRPPDTAPQVQTTGIAEDFLAYRVSEWRLPKLLNFLLMLAIPASKKIAIVTSVRDEGLGILEWLAHHRALGIQDFFIYTNDNTDGSERLLELLAAYNLIHLIKNTVQRDTPIQTKVAEHSVHFLRPLRRFEWVFYIDVDEFFIPRVGASRMDDFWRVLAQSFAEPPAAICFNWKWFGSENAFAREQGLLLERFVHSIHNEHVKSLVRLQDIVSISGVHAPAMLPGKRAVRSDFKETEASAGKIEPVYGTGQLNHYWNKSFQEFVLKKRRGRISQSLNGDELDYSAFFEWGLNGRRGNFDPPPASVLDRTKQALKELLAIPGMRDLQEQIERHFEQTISGLTAADGLAELYARHLRGIAGASANPADHKALG